MSVNIPILPSIKERQINTFYFYERKIRFWDGKRLLCQHKRYQDICKDCKGSRICEHNQRKSRCLICKGSNICVHEKIKEGCKQCKGSSICIHGKHKRTCKPCGGSRICPHGLGKQYCKECGNFCPHGKHKHFCIDCGGASLCEHKIRKSKCKECGGSDFCEHNKRKTHCKKCGGTRLCKSEWCETSANKRYDNYCLRCYIHLFPDKPVSKNYKTKEYTVVEHIKKKFIEYDWIHDKKIEDGCSAKRPDLLLDLGYQVIIIEIDENQHDTYDCTCENKRLMLLCKDLNYRPVIFLRFNPDEYIEKGKKITGCFGFGKNGLCKIKKCKEKEWIARLEILEERIVYWTKNTCEKTLEIEQIFYDNNL